MNNLINTEYNSISHKCNLNKIDQELQNPKLISLFKQNYKISAIIPVEENGEPTAILILDNKNSNNINYLYISLIALTTTILNFCLTLI